MVKEWDICCPKLQTLVYFICNLNPSFVKTSTGSPRVSVNNWCFLAAGWEQRRLGQDKGLSVMQHHLHLESCSRVSLSGQVSRQEAEIGNDSSKACRCVLSLLFPFIASRETSGFLYVPVLGKASMADLPKEKPGLVVANVKGKYHNPERFCSICDASFNNPLMAQQHYKGRKHKKRMTRAKLMETYGFSSAQSENQNFHTNGFHFFRAVVSCRARYRQ